MALQPSPDRTLLESKSREDLQTIARVKGVDAPTRATKAALIEAIMGNDVATNGAAPAPSADGPGASGPPSRAVR